MINTFIQNVVSIFVNLTNQIVNVEFLGGIILGIITLVLVLILVKFILTKGGL